MHITQNRKKISKNHIKLCEQRGQVIIDRVEYKGRPTLGDEGEEDLDRFCSFDDIFPGVE